ncbi:SLATT domain-containing protein [Francisella philomiragia]|uniref:SLATT domain-containing protein n=1 Tax=Francisella philomiragia TaxID=28110 RepID=UPI0019066713|nr:SLATT domain-containing protein [Francisella philomiragia]MBK2256670.1 SLATT domain-containing protein [Francisella philomiragia]MBK2269328.1 SLATT domain-containing protein [Francisella philomiragia]MBK2271307.1 SLATT domain-containing protein [Francisella philomiragia]MBK2275087.1 SLATT domain-containing protein [Francisella philomiragia]MBK2294681.1 SLATT domain-containing protein [Francisella philomiragia]
MDKNNFEIIKRALGNVIYSQKTQEMAYIRKKFYTYCIKMINIVLVSLVLIFLFLQIFNSEEKIYTYIGIALTIIEVIFLIFQLSFESEREAIEHKNTANRLWLFREKYLNLLTDIKNETYSIETISEKRDSLTAKLNHVYKKAPQTNSKDYSKASKALNGNEKPRADDEELANFLPENLR